MDFNKKYWNITFFLKICNSAKFCAKEEGAMYPLEF
jgi:hypothetical protein